MNAITTLATTLAAARIQALGGRPLTQDEMTLCVYEAYAMNKFQSEVQTGIDVGDKLANGLANHGAAVLAHQRQEQLNARLPQPSETAPLTEPRL